MDWDSLLFWQSVSWLHIQDFLDEEEQRLCPSRENLFTALDATPYDKVRVMFMGQDPYPNPEYATGLAFSIPKRARPYPNTLRNLFREYKSDLGYPDPPSGDLSSWAKQGVLLWNACPVSIAGKPLWCYKALPEWDLLTQEIIDALQQHPLMIFVFMGAIARNYSKYIDQERHILIETSHPSPRGSFRAKRPFLGSRIFSTVNSYLLDPIDWRLDRPTEPHPSLSFEFVEDPCNGQEKENEETLQCLAGSPAG